MPENKVQVEITGTFQGLVAALEGAKGNLQGMAWNVGRLTEAFQGMGEAFIVALGADAVMRFAERMAEGGAQLQHMAQETGLAVAQIGAFAYAAREMGVGTDAAGLALNRLERNMVLANSGESLQARAAFQALGISATDAAGKIKPLAEILPELADRFAATADGPTKTAIAMSLFGRAGMQLIPILDQGAAGLAQLGIQAREAGTLTAAMAARDEDAASAFADLGSAMDGAFQSIFYRIEPALERLARGLTMVADGVVHLLGVTDQAKLDGLTEQFRGLEAQLQRVDAEIAAGGWSHFLTAGLERQ
ncbi:MAG TPA: phage tail tape measure protein, partial [Stellaceae bacterium]|nr:phage tail tape measure protein [Stellaceae bacterium]